MSSGKALPTCHRLSGETRTGWTTRSADVTRAFSIVDTKPNSQTRIYQPGNELGANQFYRMSRPLIRPLIIRAMTSNHSFKAIDAGLFMRPPLESDFHGKNTFLS